VGTYSDAGVDLDAAAKAVSLIRGIAERAARPEVVGGVGGFAGLFRISQGKLLAAATDGVGTKTEIARQAGRLDTIGIDLVAMCADDVVCSGAEPLFLLDYVAMGQVVPERAAALVEGISEGCLRAGCALLGGETAEHPGILDPDEFDLAGFCVGIVDEDRLLGPHRVREGDVLVGLPSSGLHSNGYSLVRASVLARHRLDDMLEPLRRPLVDELLEPTAIYAPLVLELARAELIHAAAHITGGGLHENVARALPERFVPDIDTDAWTVPPVFDLVQRESGASSDEMFGTFNMGVGMVLVVSDGTVDDVRGRTDGFVIGRVTAP
jgi:phosphoribosylformylglycinamidine cyclo-ligase